MNEKTVAKVLLKASEMLKADSDYVYDPDHKNRPHGGGTWYKTPKGWSTNKKDEVKNNDSDHQYTSEQKDLAKKAKSSNWKDRSAAAWNENTPIDVLTELSHDEYKSVRQGVAHNQMTHPNILTSLANDENWEVRIGVSSNPGTPSKTLDEMSRSGDKEIQIRVAKNIGTSSSTLDDLADSDKDIVVENVIHNPKTSADTLKKIYSRGSSWENLVDSEFRKRGISSSDLKKKSDDGDELAKKWLEERKKLRHDFCKKELGDEVTYSQLKSYKESLSELKDNDSEQIKQDFTRNMDPSMYNSPKEFKDARKRIQEMPTSKFDRLFGIIYNKDEE